MYSNNTSGAVGVSWNGSRWHAYICHCSKIRSLGYYEYKEDAIFARMTAEKDLGHWLDRAVDDL